MPATVTERTPETPGLASLPAAVKPTAIACACSTTKISPFLTFSRSLICLETFICAKFPLESFKTTMRFFTSTESTVAVNTATSAAKGTILAGACAKVVLANTKPAVTNKLEIMVFFKIAPNKVRGRISQIAAQLIVPTVY